MGNVAVFSRKRKGEAFIVTLSFYWAVAYLACFLVVAMLVDQGLDTRYALAGRVLAGSLLAAFFLSMGLGLLQLCRSGSLRKARLVSSSTVDARLQEQVTACGCLGRSVSKVGDRYRCEVCGRLQ